MQSTMKKKGGYGRKVISIVAAATMAMSLMLGSAVSAYALDTGGQTGTGSITIHKYKTDTTASTVGTGKDGQTVDGTPLAGAVFTITPLDTAKVEGVGATAVTQVSDVANALNTYKSSTAAAFDLTTTADAAGVTQSGLAFGYYFVHESTVPEGTTASADAIITLPYKSSDGTYVTNVHVYPKDVNNSPVVKKVTSTTQEGVIGEGDTVAYSIVSNINATAKTQIVNGSQYMSLTIKDTPNYVTEGNLNYSVLTYASATAKINFADGTSTTLPVAGNFTATDDLGATSGTTNTPSYTWALTSAGATAIANAWKDGTTITSIEIDPTFTANSHITKLADKQGLVNKANVSATDTTGSKLIDNKTGETDPVPTGAFDFTKMGWDLSSKAVSALAGTTWHVATSEANANAGTFLTDNGTALTWTSDANGKVAISGLVSTTLKDGTASYSAVSKAYADALASAKALTSAGTGTAQTVDLWIVENGSPTGYQGLAPQKVTLTITATKAADGTYSFTTTSGNGNITTTAGYKAADATALVNAAGTDFGIMNTPNGGNGQGSFSLPNTGGMGTILFAVVGVALIAAGCFYFLRRRNRKEQ